MASRLRGVFKVRDVHTAPRNLRTQAILSKAGQLRTPISLALNFTVPVKSTNNAYELGMIPLVVIGFVQHTS